MPRLSRYIFVLWADRFEEATATIFITELRKVGLRVKVVSPSRKQTKGAYGLALVPDFTLEQALPFAAQTSCCIIPSSVGVAKQLKTDPRLREFFAQAQTNRARFVIGQMNGASWVDLGLPASREEVAVYPERDEALMTFARDIAASLSQER